MKRVVKNGKTGSRQSYPNSRKFDPNKYKLEKERVPHDLIEKMTSLCCRRCCEIISWKVEYGKYEILQRAKKCNLCAEKTVCLAYHRICQECSKNNVLCAKCQKNPSSKSIVVEQSDSEQSCSDDDAEIEMKENSKYAFVDNVIDPELSFLKGLDARLVLKKLNQERFEAEREKLSKLRERERRTILRNNNNNVESDNESCSDEEL